MKTKKNYGFKICPVCNEQFKLGGPHQKYCKACLENRSQEIQRLRANKRALDAIMKTTSKSIDMVVHEIEEFNRQNGTHISYGKYISAKSLKTLVKTVQNNN